MKLERGNNGKMKTKMDENGNEEGDQVQVKLKM